MKIKTGVFSGRILILVLMIACILPVCAIETDGVMRSDDGSGKYGGTKGIESQGHAVLFKNDKAIIITGIQVYGCKFGTGSKNISVEIWDKDLNLLYQDSILLDGIAVGKMRVVANNCAEVASWADIPLPNHPVNGDFYVVIFTYTPQPNATNQGMGIGYTLSSSTKTSHIVKENPNILDDTYLIAGKYYPTQIDWMIRTLYEKSPASMTTTPAGTTVSGVSPILMTTEAPISASKPESTKAVIGIELVVFGLVSGILLWKRS